MVNIETVQKNVDFFANQGTTEDFSVVPRLWPSVAKDLVDRVVLAYKKERCSKPAHLPTLHTCE